MLKDLPAPLPTLRVAAIVDLVKVQLDGSEITAQLGRAITTIDDSSSAILEPGTRGLVVLVKLPMVQKKIQFPATESVQDVLAREGYVDPFVKDVSTEAAR